MLMRSSWILLFFCFWAWRLAAEPQITFPKDTKLSATAQTEIVASLVKACAIATDFAGLTLVTEVQRSYPQFDLFLLTFNVQYEATEMTEEIGLRIRDFSKSGGDVEVYDVRSSSEQCFYRGIFLSKWFNDATYEYEPWMQGLESLRQRFNVDEMNVKMRFTAYDSKDFLRTEKRIAELAWKEVFGISGTEPFPCGTVFKGEYKAGKTEEGYLLSAHGNTAVDTCYNEEVAKTWMYSLRVQLNEDNRSGEIEFISSRQAQPESRKKPDLLRP